MRELSIMRNRLKNKHAFIALAIFIIVMMVMVSCNKKDSHAAHDEYTCPMHPTVVQDKPGTCPICGMDLVKKSRQGDEVKITAELGYLLKPTNAIVTSSIKTITPTRKDMEVKAEVKGVVVHDTRKLATISARYGGRIEKLFIRYNQQAISKGQKIFEIYSPELITAQRELLYLLKSDSTNTRLIDASKQKLGLLGMSEAQVNKLISSKEESYSFPVYSPVNGYIMEHPRSDKDEMSGRSEITSELKVREGMYVTPGESIFTVVSHSDLWAEFDVHQRDVPAVKLSDPLTITVDNSSEGMQAKVDLIQPFIKDGESLTKVRSYLQNPHQHYHAGELVTATFTSSANRLWIPISSKLDLGTQEIVFIKRRGTFRPQVISSGRQSDNWIEVLKGVEPGDSLAYNSQFMVDSESFIKVRN